MTSSASSSTTAVSVSARLSSWLWFPVGLALLCWDRSATASVPKLALLCVLGLLGAAWLAYRQVPLRGSLPLGFASLWVLWCALSLSWGSLQGVLALCTLLAALCLSLLAASFFSVQHLRAQLVQLARLVGTGAGVGVMAQYALGARGAALHGGMGNPNWLGLVLALCVVLSWPALLPRHSRPMPSSQRASQTPAPSFALQVFFLAVTAVQLLGLWLAQSRVAWVACGAAGLYAGLNRKAPERRAAWLVPVAALAAIAAGLGAGAPAQGGGLLSAWSGRRFIWRATLEAWLASPFGTGTGGFGTAYMRAQGRILAEFEPGVAARAFQHAESAHSDWLQALLEQGPIGFCLLALWLGVGLYRADWVRGGAALMVVLVSATGDNLLSLPAACSLALLSTAALATAAPVAFGRALSRTSAAWWAILLVLGICTRQAAGAWLAERSAYSARQYPERRLAQLTRSVALHPHSAERQLELGVALLDQPNPMAAYGRATNSAQLSRSLAAELVRAKALSQTGDYQAARNALLRALELHPASFRAQLGLASVSIELGLLDDAETALQRAQRVLPGDPQLEPVRERLRAARQAKELF